MSGLCEKVALSTASNASPGPFTAFRNFTGSGVLSRSFSS